METASFGAWVRRRRVTLDLTQTELARRVACAPITVRKIEADERRPSKVMAERLAQALELDEASTPRFVAAARAVVSPARVTTPAASGAFGVDGSLPAPTTPLLGREQTVADALDLLAVSGGPARLLTVTGPPGVGKTRFAVEVAERALRKFDVPPVFVDLSVVADPGAVPARIASTVATPAAALVDVTDLASHALGRIPTLLVLDNAEHVVEGLTQVGTLLERCPDLTVLVTSRRALDLYGEHCLPLAPLDPDDALALLVERASALDPALGALVDGPDGAALCAAVDGLPLAVELAARRLRDHEPAELVEAIGGSGDALGGAERGRAARQHSITATLRWSHDLLDEPERHLLERVAVFAGPFDRELAAAVVPAAAPAAIARGLEELRQQGLLQASPRGVGPTRYRLLAVVRSFALERLTERDDLGAARADHARAVSARATACTPGIEAWPEREDIDALAALEPDVLAALDWCFGDGADPATGRALVFAIGPLWFFRGQVGDLVHWAVTARDSLTAAAPLADHHRCAYYLAVARWSAGDLAAATSALVDAVDGAAAAGDATWLAEALGMQQLVALTSGDVEGAEALTERCVAAAADAGLEWQILAEIRAVTLARLRGDLEAAGDHAHRAAVLAPESGTFSRALARAMQANVDLDLGRPREAIAGYLAAAELFDRVDCEIYTVAWAAAVVNALVALADAEADEAAARLCGLVEAWCDHLGAPLHPMPAFPFALARAQLEQRLGGRFVELAADGAARPPALPTVEALVAEHDHRDGLGPTCP